LQENENHITHICPNCNISVQPIDKYCSNCGQKQISKKLSLGQLFQEFVDNFFNIDARIWRTLMGIFVPGKLTTQYFLGRHQSYSNPIRFFLVTSIILFTIFSFKGLDFLNMELVDSDLWKKTERSIHFKEFHAILDSVATDLKAENTSPITQITLDSLQARMPQPEVIDSIEGEINISVGDVKLSPIDIVQLDEEELLKRYGFETYTQQLVMKQFVRVIKKSGNFANFIWSNFPLMLLFMMPALALLMKLFYIRGGRYFVEHLVFSFHIHAFLFLISGFLVLIDSDWLPDWLYPLFLFLFSTYLFAALYRYYGQGVGKTFVKFSLLAVGYVLLLLLAFLVTFLVSAVVF